NATPSPPLSKLATAIFPGIGAAVPVYGGAAAPPVVVVVATNCMDAILPTAPDGPAVSIMRRAICVPAFRVSVVETLCQLCHPPVFGILMVPDTFVPFISRWNVPPCPDDAI